MVGLNSSRLRYVPRIYKITNLINGKIYIGKFSGPYLESYFKRKLKVAMQGNRDCVYLANAIRKYGPENFSLSVLAQLSEQSSPNLLCSYERYYIAALHSQDHNIGYNIASGGEGGSGPISEKHKAVLRAASKKIVFSEERRKSISERMKGRKHSLETRRKIALAHTGMRASKETCLKISLIRKAQWKNPEFRTKGLSLLKSSTSTLDVKFKRSQNAKKQFARYSSNYRSWIAKKAVCSRWGLIFEDPKPEIT